MTQQGDMTSQESGANQPGQVVATPATPAEPLHAPAPTWPSPYLPEGQSVPEAYPAPPQPGKPRYGGGSGPFRLGQGEQPGSGFGEPKNAQPGYGPAGRPAPRGRTMIQRDPALAGLGERVLATTVDWLLILIVAFLAELPPMLRLWHQVRAVVGSQNPSQPAVQAAIDNIVREPATVNTWVIFWLITFGVALAYFWVLPVIWGATIGKWLVGLRVVTATDRTRVSIWAAGIRAALFLLGPAILVLAPQVELLGGVLWIADGMLVLLDFSRMQSLHDRLAGTTVVRKRWLDKQRATPPTPW